MSDARIETYAEFWPFYLKEHGKQSTRVMHYVGTSLAVSLFCYAVATQHYGMLLAAPLPGYAFAWVSHFFIEHNRPATFKYPLWSLYSDFKMLGYMLIGRLNSELQVAPPGV